MSRAAATWPTLDRSDRPTIAIWVAFVTAAGVITSFAFACITPFAALGAICALRLRRRSAALTTAGVWLANQIVGFGFLGYPRDAGTFAWGGALLVAALVATASAALVARLLRHAGTVVRGGLAVASAYVAVQAAIALAGLFLHGDAFSLALQRELIVENAVTFGAVAALGWAAAALLARGRQRLPNPRPGSSHPSGRLPV